MRTLVFILSGIMSFCASAAVKESKWCKVELPDSVPGGSDFQIRVTPVRDLPQGCNLSIHMHYMRSDGRWGGMYEWRPAQNAKKGKTSVFSFKARNDGKARTLSPIMFVAPGGDFGKKIARVNYEDGCKVYFEDDSFVICRFSGTEPLLRIFAESSTAAEAAGYIKAFKTFLNI